MSQKNIQIRILIRLDNNLRKVADLMITAATGDIYYKPSTNKQLTENLKVEQFEHFSFHKSGQILLKINDLIHKSIRQGLPTKYLGFQKLLSDLILEPAKLPLHTKTLKSHDIVFGVADVKQQIVLILSIVSGKLIVKSIRGENKIIKPIEIKGKEEVLGLKNIALGHESGNADKMLQLLCLKTNGDPRKLSTKRMTKIYKDENIRNE